MPSQLYLVDLFGSKAAASALGANILVSTKNKLISYPSRSVIEPSARNDKEWHANLFLLNSSGPFQVPSYR